MKASQTEADDRLTSAAGETEANQKRIHTDIGLIQIHH